MKLCPRRRPVRFSSGHIGGKGEKEELAKRSDALPECGEGETYRDIIRIDRSKRPRFTANEQTVMGNCNRPLGISERRERHHGDSRER